MKKQFLPNWLLPSVALCAILALASIYYRVRVEGRNKATEIAVEIESVQNLGASQGLSMQASLGKLRDAGLGALVLTETTLADLLNAHQLELNLRRGGATLSVTDPDTAEATALQRRVMSGIKRRWPALKIDLSGNAVNLQGEIPSLSALRGLSIGLDPTEAKTTRRAGLRIIARFANPIGVTDGYVKGTLAQARLDGASVYLPLGEQVLGRRESIKALEDSLRNNEIVYASPEFAKLGGDVNVLEDMPENVVRLHSAQAAELDKLPLVEAIDRYSKASRERNQRILLLRPISNAAEKPLDSLEDFVAKVAKAVVKQGNKIGPSKPFSDSNPPRFLFLLIGLALVAPVAFVANYWNKSQQIQFAVIALLALLGVACWMPHGRMPMAILASLAFPILAFMWLDANSAQHPVLLYLAVTAISLVGGLCVAGLLNGLPYFVRAEQFMAVKLSVFLPILVVGLYFLAGQTDLRAVIRDPLTYRTALLGLVLIGILGFMLSRTGNDNPAGVSSVELKMRDILDRVLFVRPRTKEFLFGHPALIIGILLLALQRSKPTEAAHGSKGGWIALCLTLGAMGQTDVVNTMCHFHTPVLLSLSRIAVGWIAGGIVGFALWLPIRHLLRRWSWFG